MEGLLHLCGIAAAVSIAYVGLDQLNWDDRRFETHLSDARRKIGESLLRYGLQVGTLNPSDSCDLFPTPIRLRLFVLCHVGRVRLAGCDIAGRFVPLRVPRSVLVSLFSASDDAAEGDKSWRQLLAEFFAGRSGPVDLDQLYRYFTGHRKSATNPNFDAKLRQQLQRGPYRRIGRGLWEAAQ